jgi:hypothetical protein
VTASGNSAVQAGFDTDDGWHIQFTRFMVSIGHAGFTKTDSCTTYSDANYERVLDLLQPGQQKVNLIYGLGSCNLEFRVAYPNSNSLAGVGVTDNDITLMRTQGNDRYTSSQGMNGFISGAASKSGQLKTFTWMFRQNWYYSSCRTAAGDLANLDLPGGEQRTVNLLVYGERLFLDLQTLDTPGLAFEPMAQADSMSGNNDGEVSLDELAAVPVTLSNVPGKPPHTSQAADAGMPTDLELLVYMSLFPEIVRYDGSGPCRASPQRPGRD